MNYTEIHTGGIGYLSEMEGSDVWKWGSDYTSGDLYEAEELFRMKHRIKANRLILMKMPEETVYEPVPAEEGCYFGAPVFEEGKVMILRVDFIREIIQIIAWKETMTPQEITQIPLSAVKDCYNLMLEVSPLMLARQGAEKRFDILWPEQRSFEIGSTESFDRREGEELIFSRWYEDPDYREETVIRSYPDGEIREVLEGSLLKTADGHNWLLK